MIAVTVDEIATLLGAQISGSGDRTATVTALTADSRTIPAGALFVALRGEHVDGHDYVGAAAAAGAAASLTRHPVPGALCVLVVDPLVALGRISRYLIDRASAGGLQVVGITGSVGKTSTKDLLGQVLERAGPTVAAVGNLNNELGVPLTVGDVDELTRYLVVEMGARGIGHIAYLCDIAPPRVGVVLNVGQAHVGEFGGQAAIARAKGELVEALPPDGWAVLNIDDPLVWSMRRRTRAQVLPWSTIQPLDDGVWASDLVGDAHGRYSFALHDGRDDQSESRCSFSSPAGIRSRTRSPRLLLRPQWDLSSTRSPLRSLRPVRDRRWRMELHDRSDGVTVINDAYNANPDSMRAALTTLAELGRAGRHTWAVLGDMLELGETAADEHAAIGRFAAQSGVEHLVAIGEYATRDHPRRRHRRFALHASGASDGQG